MIDYLRWGFILAVTAAATTLTAVLTTVKPTELPRYGHRGAERQGALEKGGLFALCDPLMRYVAALVGRLPLQGWRAEQERELRRADDAFGLTPDELSALALLSSVGLGLAVGYLARLIGLSFWLPVAAMVFGLVLPTVQVREVIRARAKAVGRALPPAIEIAAMCMGAGLDFPGSLRMLAERSSPRPSPLAREFRVILEHLDYGHTREEALLQFAERVPSPAVRDFVHAVIQAERKGNPLAAVLQVQGRTLNQRRSVAAEEAAARAGVLLILPMVLLLSAILLLLMGPFLVKGIGI